jgi:hypothetical protein
MNRPSSIGCDPRDMGASLRDRAVVKGAADGVSALRASIPSAVRWLAGLLRPKPKPAAGHVHINWFRADAKSLTADKCPDCKQATIFVGFFQEWYGWTETCIRCGRRFADGEWLELEFSREARRDNIKSAIETWGRFADAERIHRVKSRPAQAIEARRAETGTGSVHESAVSEGDAP